jgi:hypothetical protein
MLTSALPIGSLFETTRPASVPGIIEPRSRSNSVTAPLVSVTTALAIGSMLQVPLSLVG